MYAKPGYCTTIDQELAMDACLNACRGTMDKQFFKIRFPAEILELTTNITHLEMLALIAGMKLCKANLQGKYIRVHVDNEAVAMIINTGKSRDKFCYITSTGQFMVKAWHISGVDNRILALLSRAWIDPRAMPEFRRITHGMGYSQVTATTLLFKFTHSW